jgi:hypothetical protein
VTYEVGQFYKVPCVFGQLGRMPARWWPVMGGLHDDKAIIGFPLLHYHVDWRFVPERGLYASRRGSYVYPLQTGNGLNDSGFGPPQLRRRKCQDVHRLPFEGQRISWMPKLEQTYSACKLAHGHVCPHRGYDLSRETPDAEGIVTCPLHGLRWNINTGELVPRTHCLAAGGSKNAQ